MSRGPIAGDPPPDEPSAARTGGLEPAVADELRAGEAFGRYRGLTFLGAGGMATVYRAFDPVLGRPVALKLIRGGDPALAERLLAEARAQARVEHERVCRIYDAGEIGGRPYIAMQFVEGSTLRSLAGAAHEGGGRAGRRARRVRAGPRPGPAGRCRRSARAPRARLGGGLPLPGGGLRAGAGPGHAARDVEDGLAAAQRALAADGGLAVANGARQALLELQASARGPGALSGQ